MKIWKFFIVLVTLHPSVLMAKQGGGQGFFVSPALFYMQESQKIATTSAKGTTEVTTTILNTTMGYAVGNGLLLGLKYYDEQRDTEYETANDIGKAEVKVRGIGPTVGYEFGAFKLTATLFVLDDPKRTEKDGNKTIYSEGSGQIVDALYMFDVGSIGVGPQLSLIEMTYKREEVNGTENTTFKSRTDRLLLPSVAFWFSF